MTGSPNDVDELFRSKILPAAAKHAVSCRFVVRDRGVWNVGAAPPRATVTLDASTFFEMRKNYAKQLPELLASRAVELAGDELHALEMAVYVAQADMFFAPQIALNTYGRVRIARMALFRATASALKLALPAFLPRPKKPRSFEAMNPFTKKMERRSTDLPDVVPGAPYPLNPPFPWVELPIAFGYANELLALYGRTSGWGEEAFRSEPDVDALFPDVLFGGEDVQVVATPEPWLARLAALSGVERGEVAERLLDAPEPRARDRLVTALAAMTELAARGAGNGEALWILGARLSSIRGRPRLQPAFGVASTPSLRTFFFNTGKGALSGRGREIAGRYGPNLT